MGCVGLTHMKLQCHNPGAFHPTRQSVLYFNMCPCVAGWFCGQQNSKNCRTDFKRIPDGGWVSKLQMFTEEEIPHTKPENPHNTTRDVSFWTFHNAHKPLVPTVKTPELSCVLNYWWQIVWHHSSCSVVDGSSAIRDDIIKSLQVVTLRLLAPANQSPPPILFILYPSMSPSVCASIQPSSQLRADYQEWPI